MKSSKMNHIRSCPCPGAGAAVVAGGVCNCWRDVLPGLLWEMTTFVKRTQARSMGMHVSMYAIVNSSTRAKSLFNQAMFVDSANPVLLAASFYWLAPVSSVATDGFYRFAFPVHVLRAFQQTNRADTGRLCFQKPWAHTHCTRKLQVQCPLPVCH